MYTAGIKTKKIDKTALNVSANGDTFLNIALIFNKDGTDKYGNDGFIVQQIPGERRAKGERGAILGNFKKFYAKEEQAAQQSTPPPASTPSPGKGDDPFS